MYERFEYDLSNASFDWYDDKDRINFIKHGEDYDE